VVETEITISLLLFLALMIWAMARRVKSAKLKKTGSTLVIAAMFGFAELLNPRQVDIEEARQKAPRKNNNENGNLSDKIIK